MIPEIRNSSEKDKKLSRVLLTETKSTSGSILKPRHTELDSLDWDKIFKSPQDQKFPLKSPAYPKSQLDPSSPRMLSTFRTFRTSKSIVPKVKSSTRKKTENGDKYIIKGKCKETQLDISQEQTGVQNLKEMLMSLRNTQNDLLKLRTDAREISKNVQSQVIHSKKRQRNISVDIEGNSISTSFNRGAQKSILRQLQINLNLLSKRLENFEERQQETIMEHKSIDAKLNALKLKISVQKEQLKTNLTKGENHLSKCLMF